MPLLPYPSAKDVPEEYRGLLEKSTNTQKMLMYSLEGSQTYLNFGEWIRFKSHLNPRLREMVILQIGYLFKNEYIVGHHIKISEDFGVSEADLCSIMAETANRVSDLSPSETTALRATREIAKNRRISDETAKKMLVYFTPELLLEIVLIAGFYTFAEIFVGTLSIDIEESFKQYLIKMPFEKM